MPHLVTLHTHNVLAPQTDPQCSHNYIHSLGVCLLFAVGCSLQHVFFLPQIEQTEKAQTCCDQYSKQKTSHR